MMVNTFRKKTFDTTQLGSLHLLGNSSQSFSPKPYFGDFS